MGKEIHFKTREQMELSHSQVLPDFHIRFDQLMNQSTASIEEFVNIIQTDADLGSKVLELVNNAYSDLSGEIKSLSRAIKLLGIQQLHILVLSHAAMACTSAAKVSSSDSRSLNFQNTGFRTISDDMAVMIDPAA